MAQTPVMNQNEPSQNGNLSLDWIVRGILTTLGDIFDRATGRGWRPSSSLATSELIEKLKVVLDNEAVTDENGRVLVPHNIRLNMQWDKFSADSESSLQMLQNELLVAAVDHINDRKYYTKAPIRLDVRPDYFTSGVVLRVSFEEFGKEEVETALQLDRPSEPKASQSEENRRFRIEASFSIGGRLVSQTIDISPGQRLSIGRSATNDLVIDDESVSKIHASLFIDSDGRMRVADTGSTNGTFIEGKRISYGKSHEAGRNKLITFGGITVKLEVSNPVTGGSAEDNPEMMAGDRETAIRSTAEIDENALTARQNNSDND